jgi:hypothetical protein
MDNKEFDKNIKQRLEGLQGQVPQNDWDDFSKILGQDEEFQDVFLDQKYSDALKGQSKGFNSLHWVLLKNRLEKEALLRKEIYKTKLFESVLVILLAFTFINVNRFYNLSPQEQNDNNSFAINEALLYPNLASLVKHSNPPLVELPKTQLAKIVKKNPRTNYSIKASSLPYIPSFADHLSTNIIKLNGSLQGVEDQQKNKFIDNDLTASDVMNTNNKRAILSEPTKLEHIKPIKFELADAYPNFYFKPDIKPISKYYLTTGFTNNINVIKSPEDKLFGVDAYNVVESGVSFNVGVGTRIGNYELSTGVDYVRVSYDPKEITEYTSTNTGLIQEKKLKKVKFQIIQVPLNFGYHLNPNKKNHFWGRFGVGMNLAILSNYDINTTQLERVPELNNYSIVNLTSRDGSSVLDKKNFHPGALEQGAFFDNFFLSSHIDLGLERKLSKNVSLLASLGYSTSFSEKGIGPNQDTYNTIRMGLGLSFRI